MPLTPQDVTNKKFTTKLRGYDPDEVDAFLDDVEGELVRLLTDNAGLQQRLATAPIAAAPAPAPIAPVVVPEAIVPPPAAAPAPIAPAETQEAALRTLLMAQRTADQAIAEARAEADALLAAAQQRGVQMDQEVNARTAAAMADLESRRVELESRIDDLRLFEREYRLRLKAYLEGQLKDLDGRGGSTDGPGTGVPAPARQAAITSTPQPPVPATTPPPAAAPPGAHAAPLPEMAMPQVLPAEWAELHEGAEPAPATGAPRDPAAPTLRAVPPLTTEPEPVGPFTVVPSPPLVEHVDEGPEPLSET